MMAAGGATLGIVGLGFVGRAFAQRAIAAGMTVLGTDPSRAAREAAAAMGVRMVDASAAPGASVADADLAADASAHAAFEALCARSDALLVAVLDDAQLDAVSAALAHALSACRSVAGATSATLVISAVTCSPGAADRAAARIAATGADFVDLPMSGSSVAIADGTALGLIGATDAGWQRHQALLQALAPSARRVGPPGSGARAKLATNLVLGLNRAALAEGLALAASLGIDGDDFLALLRASPAYSRAVDLSGPRMVARDFTPRSRVAQHRKDLRLMLAAGEGAGLDLALTRAHAALLDRAIANGYGDADNVAVIGAFDPPKGP